MDVEFTSVLTDSTKLVIYYLSVGFLWLDDVQSNHQIDYRDRVICHFLLVSDARSYEICQNNHRQPLVKGAVFGRHPDSIHSMQVETNQK